MNKNDNSLLNYGFKPKEEAENADMTPIFLDDKYETKILMVRHGQSLGNMIRRFLGTTDLDLSPLGYRQAYRTAEFLSTVKADAVYSSDLQRAFNTAIPHARIRGLEVTPYTELREMYAGVWEGLMVEDIIKDYHDKFLYEWRDKFGLATLPEGENVQDAASRFYKKVFEIANENKGKTVIIAAHAAVIRAFWGRITKTKPEDLAGAYFYPENASVSVVYFDGNELIPGEYSHDQHLRDLI